MAEQTQSAPVHAAGITDAMIETLARELTSHNFDGMGTAHQRDLRERARRVLEAALDGCVVVAPHQLADLREALAGWDLRYRPNHVSLAALGVVTAARRLAAVPQADST